MLLFELHLCLLASIVELRNQLCFGFGIRLWLRIAQTLFAVSQPISSMVYFRQTFSLSNFARVDWNVHSHRQPFPDTIVGQNNPRWSLISIYWSNQGARKANKTYYQIRRDITPYHTLFKVFQTGKWSITENVCTKPVGRFPLEGLHSQQVTNYFKPTMDAVEYDSRTTYLPKSLLEHIDCIFSVYPYRKALTDTAQCSWVCW